MNIEIGSEAAQFPEKEYINGIFDAVWRAGMEPLLAAPLATVAAAAAATSTEDAKSVAVREFLCNLGGL
jgi:hypothetical protein